MPFAIQGVNSSWFVGMVVLGVVVMGVGWVAGGMCSASICRGCMAMVVMMPSPSDHMRYPQQACYEKNCRQKGLIYEGRRITAAAAFPAPFPFTIC